MSTARHTVRLLTVLLVFAACSRRSAEKAVEATRSEGNGATGTELRSADVGRVDPSRIEPKDPFKAADADMRRVLVEHGSLGTQPNHELSVEQARRQPTLGDAMLSLLKREGRSVEITKVADTLDRNIPGPGGDIPVRIYTPTTRPNGGPLCGVVLYFHGGGFVVGDLHVHDASARALSQGSQAIVVSAGYRRAPEHKFPAAHDDALSAYEWLSKNAASFGGDPGRLAVAGEGVGANLAANVSIAARDRKDLALLLPLHQLLIYPVTQTNLETPSYKEWAFAKPFETATIAWFFDHALRTSSHKQDPRLDLMSVSMKGLPATTIVLAEIDPLWSDGDMLHRAMHAAGVKVETKTFEGVTHGFFGLGAYVRDARRAEEWASERLKATLFP